MTQSEKALDQFLDQVVALTKVPQHDVSYGLDCMRAWRALAVRTIGFDIGDRVVILDSYEPHTDDGWRHHRECLIPGQTAEVRDLTISPDTLHVAALIRMETEWEVVAAFGTQPARRYNNELSYDGTKLEDRRHVFYFPVEHLRPATDDDKALPYPNDIPLAVSEVAS